VAHSAAVSKFSTIPFLLFDAGGVFPSSELKTGSWACFRIFKNGIKHQILGQAKQDSDRLILPTLIAIRSAKA
jgi:hypothetical protein